MAVEWIKVKTEQDKGAKKVIKKPNVWASFFTDERTRQKCFVLKYLFLAVLFFFKFVSYVIYTFFHL